MIAEETVAARITAALPGFSRGQKQVARFMMDNEYVAAFTSAAEVGRRAGVSTATVVRFCQALGYEGYPHLQAAIQQSFPDFMTTVQKAEARLTSPIPESDVLARVFAADIRDIERTATLTDDDRLRAAVTEIRRARQVFVVGEGAAATAMVGFFAYTLRVMGLQVQSITSGGEPLALALAFLQPEDVVISIGFWRNLRDVVEAIQYAREIGAKTIGITDRRLSPLACLPDYPFLVATDSIAHSLSPVAMLSLLNAFVAVLSFDISDQVIESLHLVEEAYRRSGVLAE